ncbi:MAG TPA: YidC/Oxa1 family membrane protein insertase [Candidatus Saccharimonadales bacterium]|jgi:YidC/Oxa1 family membrane protein insertase|nr:YidC/Oxa1 family membrane protein insertase [Candidatus Saccharimonadales bacterium]
MFTTLIVKPIFNLLVLIYAVLPGHNFGLALIIFTIVVRLLMWPLVKKQLHQAKAMRQLQPEIKRVKQAAKGNRQQESLMMMELYKEKGINPFSTFPILIVQLLILIGLYSGLRRVITDPHAIISFAYPGLQHLSWLKQLSHNIHRFDNTLFGVVDLSRAALGKSGVYWPAMIIVLGSAVAQFYQSKQLLPDTKDQRGLRDILRQASSGKQADQSEVNAAVGRSTRYLLPVMIFIFTVNIASALSLYWLVGGIVAYIQQAIVLRGDETEMEAIADKPSKNVKDIPEAEVVEIPTAAKAAKKSSKKKSAKRRKR